MSMEKTKKAQAIRNALTMKIINAAFDKRPEVIAAERLITLGITEEEVKNLELDDTMRISVGCALRDLRIKRENRS